jgi:hypothetical protein
MSATEKRYAPTTSCVVVRAPLGFAESVHTAVSRFRLAVADDGRVTVYRPVTDPAVVAVPGFRTTVPFAFVTPTVMVPVAATAAPSASVRSRVRVAVVPFRMR